MSEFQGLEGAPLYLVGVGRATVGVLGYLAPRSTRVLFDLPGAAEADDSLDTVTRLFGVRDVVLGAGYLSSDVRVRRAAVQAGLIIDTLDALAMGVQWYNGQLSDRMKLLGCAGAAFFAALGYYMLQKHDKGKKAKDQKQ